MAVQSPLSARFVAALQPRVTHPEDTPEDTFKKGILLFMVVVTLILTVGWIILHYALGAYRVGFNLVIYLFINLAALAALLVTRRLNPAMELHVGSFFILPWTATWMEGGVQDSGFICLWCLLPIVELSIYRGAVASLLLFVVHALVAVGVIFADANGWIDRSAFDWLDFGPHVPPSHAARYTFYAINVVGTSGVTLILHLLSGLAPRARA